MTRAWQASCISGSVNKRASPTFIRLREDGEAGKSIPARESYSDQTELQTGASLEMQFRASERELTHTLELLGRILRA